MTTVVILSIGVAIAIALPIASRVLERRFDPFEPIVVFALAWGVMFVVRPIAIVVRDDTNFYGVDIGSTLDNAVLLGLVGAVAFVVGYETSLGRRLAARAPAPVNGVRVDAALAWAVVFAAAGVAAFALVLLPAGGVASIRTFFGGRSAELNELIAGSSTYLWYGSLVVVPAALVAAAVAFSDRRPRVLLTAAVLLLVALLRTVPTGNRVFLVVLVGGIVTFGFYRVKRRPGALVLGVGLVAALVVSGAVLTFRYPETRDSLGSVVRGFATSPTRALRPLYEGPDAEMAPALAGALIVVPEQLPHRFGGATVGDLVIRPIPRQIWPDKPVAPGQEVTAEVWPVAVETGGFDPAFTPMLTFYWDFAVFGVVAGMAALGVLARFLREQLAANVDAFGAQLVAAAGLWFLVVALRHDTTLVTVWGLIVFGPLIGIARLARTNGRRQRAVASLDSATRSS
jgi:hypothetical protein